jgi:hypothetical protein
MDKTCPLCTRELREPALQSNLTLCFSCETCGRFLTDQITASQLKNDKSIHHLHLISAITKEATKEATRWAEDPICVDARLLKRLREGEIRERTASEKIELMMRWYASRSIEVGQVLPFSPDTDYPAAWCRSPGEWRTIHRALVQEIGWLAAISEGVSVSVSGWKHLGELPKSAGSVAFVAMSFAKELRSVYEAIDAAIRAAGYDPVRVDQDRYIGGVMDRVLARIRESRFVVAEFAGNRGGVYYEAGFALGLGIPTICLCSQTQLDSKDPAEQLHFDVDHLHFLPWKETDLPRLTEDLREHILAVFGRGPL